MRLTLLVIALCCSSAITTLGQKQKTANPPGEDTRLAQQQELIGRLIGIVNELKSEADKPAAALLQSEVADVLWRFDEPAARSIFRLAFDTVRHEISNKPSGVGSGPESPAKSWQRISALKVILKRYGFRDPKNADAWLREFENDVKSLQTSSNNSVGVSPEQAELLTEIALGIVSQNPKEAQRLGSLALSGTRIPSGFGRLLMSLRNQNKSLSDVLFRQALLPMRRNGFLYDSALISLTNYAFFADGRVTDISPPDVDLFIQYCVDAAGAMAARSRSEAIRISDEQASLGSLYGFLKNRVLPIVTLNAPDKSVLLQSNIQEIVLALSVDQRRQAEMLGSVTQRDPDTDASIRRAEQEKNVATRDFLFRSLAIQLMRTEPERALDVARKIDDQGLRAQTEDDVYLVLMRKALAVGVDPEAKTLALKFNDLSRRARWLAQIAGKLLTRSKDHEETAELLSQAHSILAQGDNTPAKIEVFLLIAKEFVRVDQQRGFEILSDAVSTTNRVEKVPPKSSKPAFPAMRVVSITMVDGQEVSTDDRVTLDSIDFNQLSAFVERDYLRTSFVGNEIKDRFLRSKYFIMVARIVLRVPRQGSGYERTFEDLIPN